jgi:hypothetical protein
LNPLAREDNPVKRFEEKFGNTLVTFYEKPEESCVIMEARRIPQQGKRTEALTKAEEGAAILLAREWFENERNVRLLHFRKDPLAGGSTPMHPVTGQIIRTGVLREVSAPLGGPVQGKVGKIIDDHFPGQGTPTPMIQHSAWVGDW